MCIHYDGGRVAANESLVAESSEPHIEEFCPSIRVADFAIAPRIIRAAGFYPKKAKGRVASRARFGAD